MVANLWFVIGPCRIECNSRPLGVNHTEPSDLLKRDPSILTNLSRDLDDDHHGSTT